MKFLYNKFIIIFIVIILGLFLVQYQYISKSYQRDTNSYVTLMNGDGYTIQSGEVKALTIDEKRIIQTGDTISTAGEDSIALIEWGDKSITRLAGNSKIIVKENFVGEDLSKINISFELLKGKTWSNVVTILTGENHFKEEINGNVAAVRGTVFEASADDEYISVINHEVELESSDGETYSITEGETISLQDYVISALIESLDKSWEQLNQTLDKNYLKNLKTDFEILFLTSNPFQIISNKIKYYFDLQYRVYYMAYNLDEKEIKEYVSSLSEEKREKFIYELQELLQSINYESGDNEDIYNIKLKIKDLLLYFSDDENYKEAIVKYSIYDLNDLLESNIELSKEAIANTAKLLESNSGILLNAKSTIESKLMDNDIIDKIKSLKDISNIDLEGINEISKSLLDIPNKFFNLNK